jgi:hypothetical protein
MIEASAQSVLPFVIARCSPSEIAEWFSIDEFWARYLVFKAKRLHLAKG